MNVQHSPTRSLTARTGSLTNLSKTELENITQRKRKQPENECDCKDEIAGLRKELSRMTDLLEKISGKQDVTTESIKQNINDIKDQMLEIKNSTSALVTEQNNIKSELSRLNNQVSASEAKMQNIETGFVHISDKLTTTQEKLQSLESDLLQNKPTSESSNITNEQIVMEIQDRNNRMNNIIISGIPEPHDTDGNQRRQNDQQEVLKILNSVIDNCPKPKQIIRIGKYIKERNRHIKVCFTNSDTPRLLLKNKTKLDTSFKLFTDQTPMQKKIYSDTKIELNQRLQAGETNLTIKYIRGTPKIIKTQPQKN